MAVLTLPWMSIFLVPTSITRVQLGIFTILGQIRKFNNTFYFVYSFNYIYVFNIFFVFLYLRNLSQGWSKKLFQVMHMNLRAHRKIKKQNDPQCLRTCTFTLNLSEERRRVESLGLDHWAGHWIEHFLSNLRNCLVLYLIIPSSRQWKMKWRIWGAKINSWSNNRKQCTLNCNRSFSIYPAWQILLATYPLNHLMEIKVLQALTKFIQLLSVYVHKNF